SSQRTVLSGGTYGTLCFNFVRMFDARRPRLFVLENVKNRKSHDQVNTFRIIMQTLDELGYDVADAADNCPDDPKIIDGQHFLPQHRDRILLVAFLRDLNLKTDFTLRTFPRFLPPRLPSPATPPAPVDP
uniref:DNA cytosine methyltransferase n=1 Tax=Salmonella enterica TaxID=28901 RepID=UPI00398C7442